jgi:hypothetical protein
LQTLLRISKFLTGPRRARFAIGSPEGCQAHPSGTLSGSCRSWGAGWYAENALNC